MSAQAAETSSGHTSFYLRKLHSLTGIFPIGFFLLEHFWTNSAALVSPGKFDQAAGDLESAPWLFFAEIFGIWIPILYHGFYGIYVWLRGQSNVSEYVWVGSWMYAVQRYTGLIAFVFIGWHVYTERFLPHGNSTFASVHANLTHPLYFWIYVIGVTAASVHLGSGVWNFLCKWGLAATASAQRAAGYLGVVVAIVFTVVGLAIAISFRYNWHPFLIYRR
jgi:succinate dehydrogenase / fumarate reductase cytochrome b subunit